MAYLRGSGAADNKFYKMGREKKADGQETPLHIVTQFSVGSGKSQVSIFDLKRLIDTGGKIVKMHEDGNVNRPREDVSVRLGDDDRSWTKEELTEIVELVESGKLEKDLAERKRIEQEVYQAAYEKELRGQIEAEVRAEMEEKAKKEASRVAAATDGGDEPADAGAASGSAKPAGKKGAKGSVPKAAE